MFTVVDYGMGNLASVKKAFEYCSAEVLLSSKPKDIENASAVILPGVGAFAAAMRNLDSAGLIDPIKKSVAAGKPFMGICLGYQLIFSSSTEMEYCEGLDIIHGDVVKFDVSLKIPHIGWNEVKKEKESIFLEGINDGDHFYFVHSYYPKLQDPTDAALSSDYEIDFVSAVCRDNVFASQFHPEKSQEKGLRIIQNFVNFANKN